MRGLRGEVRGPLEANKDKIDASINLYECGAIGNVETPENILECLACKSTWKIHTDKTDKIYNKLVKEAPQLKGLRVFSGKRKPDVKLKNVMVTMMLYREKEDAKAEKLRENRQ